MEVGQRTANVENEQLLTVSKVLHNALASIDINEQPNRRLNFRRNVVLLGTLPLLDN